MICPSYDEYVWTTIQMKECLELSDYSAFRNPYSVVAVSFVFLYDLLLLIWNGVQSIPAIILLVFSEIWQVISEAIAMSISENDYNEPLNTEKYREIWVRINVAWDRITVALGLIFIFV
jgi:hypothetical protein